HADDGGYGVEEKSDHDKQESDQDDEEQFAHKYHGDHEKMKDEGFSGMAAHKVGIPAQQKNDQGEKDGKEKGAGVAESGQQLFLTGRGECIHRARPLS